MAPAATRKKRAAAINEDGTMTVTRREREIMRAVIHDNWQEAINVARAWGWFKRSNSRGRGEREMCELKLYALDLSVPWDGDL